MCILCRKSMKNYVICDMLVIMPGFVTWEKRDTDGR